MEDGGFRRLSPYTIVVECANPLFFLIASDGLHHETFEDTDEQITVVEPGASAS